MAVESEGTFLSKLNYVVYTHTDCLDVWDAAIILTSAPRSVSSSCCVERKRIFCYEILEMVQDL